jgi:LPPG:FO 2-phospho-L-lactate transferase
MKVVELSGGVGGARLARGLDAVLGTDLSVVVNVGDDETIHGLHVSADLDTVVYTLAGVEGSEGWGRSEDTFVFNEELARFGVDNSFRLGDLDLALNLFRTRELERNEVLSVITRKIAASFHIEAAVIPATDDSLQTEVRVEGDGWISFQDYFVLRRHQDKVNELRFVGGESADPAPGVIDAIDEADAIVIAPSNPPLSIWPILAIGKIKEAICAHPRVVAVSPLFGGKALKGPADAVMASLGLPAGSAGVAEAYRGIIDTLIVDHEDAADANVLPEIEVRSMDTRIKDAGRARSFAEELLGL